MASQLQPGSPILNRGLSRIGSLKIDGTLTLAIISSRNKKIKYNVDHIVSPLLIKKVNLLGNKN